MRTQHETGIDVDSCITKALEAKASTLAQINWDETGQKLRDLPPPSESVSVMQFGVVHMTQLQVEDLQSSNNLYGIDYDVYKSM
jgi:hypothetical protein